MRSPNLHETPGDAFKRAVAVIGSQRKTADILNMTQPAVSKILSKGGACPAEDQRVLKIEAASGISRHRLRPDVYPLESSAPDRAGDGGELEPAE